MSNKRLVLIAGKSATGKSSSLEFIPNQEGVIYLNCESGKELPFSDSFNKLTITDPYEVEEAFEEVEAMDNIHTIVVDSLTYLMDMFESQYVLTLKNKMEGWSEFQQYFKRLMQQHVAKSTKNVIFTAHTMEKEDGENIIETCVPVKGALKNNGIESYFSTVVVTKVVPLRELKDYANDLLEITEEDEILGYKHVFQTRKTKKTVGERIRAPRKMFSIPETFMDNDCGKLLQRLGEFYGDTEGSELFGKE